METTSDIRDLQTLLDNWFAADTENRGLFLVARDNADVAICYSGSRENIIAGLVVAMLKYPQIRETVAATFKGVDTFIAETTDTTENTETDNTETDNK